MIAPGSSNNRENCNRTQVTRSQNPTRSSTCWKASARTYPEEIMAFKPIKGKENIHRLCTKKSKRLHDTHTHTHTHPHTHTPTHTPPHTPPHTHPPTHTPPHTPPTHTHTHTHTHTPWFFMFFQVLKTTLQYQLEVSTSSLLGGFFAGFPWWDSWPFKRGWVTLVASHRNKTKIMWKMYHNSGQMK